MEKQNINQKEPMNEVKFADGSVPVAVAARVYGKEAHWVRAGIIVGWLPIGTATRKGQVVKTIKEMDSRYGRINYYISPMNMPCSRDIYYDRYRRFFYLLSKYRR